MSSKMVKIELFTSASTNAHRTSNSSRPRSSGAFMRETTKPFGNSGDTHHNRLSLPHSQFQKENN